MNDRTQKPTDDSEGNSFHAGSPATVTEDTDGNRMFAPVPVAEDVEGHGAKFPSPASVKADDTEGEGFRMGVVPAGDEPEDDTDGNRVSGV